MGEVENRVICLGCGRPYIQRLWVEAEGGDEQPTRRPIDSCPSCDSQETRVPVEGLD